MVVIVQGALVDDGGPQQAGVFFAQHVEPVEAQQVFRVVELSYLTAVVGPQHGDHA